MAKKRRPKTKAQLEDELRKARSSARNARIAQKKYEEGIQAGLRLAKDARRD